jgi:hypothetical protein
MHSINRGMTLCALALLLAAGCESVALMPRPDIDDRAGNGRAAQPDRYAHDRAAPQSRGEVVGTVERVDDIRREIHLRTDDRRNVVLKYDPSTLVLDRDRQFSVGDLRSGDFVRAEPSRGEYVDVIHILEASRS